ncbi:TPA: hypothetical protein HA344_08325 [Candidatus Bathyarchaeota archaeon]|nr:hypothetical protein [Candidatus Bathyarchaeota archaeon]
MEFDIVTILISIIGGAIIMAPVLWIAGRMLVGSTNAKFTDAIMIVVLSSIANTVVGLFIGGIIGSLASLVVTLYLIKKYYECSWGKAAVVAIVTTVIFVIIAVVLGMVLGISLGGGFI